MIFKYSFIHFCEGNTSISRFKLQKDAHIKLSQYQQPSFIQVPTQKTSNIIHFLCILPNKYIFVFSLILYIHTHLQILIQSMLCLRWKKYTVQECTVFGARLLAFESTLSYSGKVLKFCLPFLYKFIPVKHQDRTFYMVSIQ